MEMRLLAVAAKESRLIEFFNKQTPKDDFFKFVASMWKGTEQSQINEIERNRTKKVVYACVYGSGIKIKLFSV
jgi:DNA polymerase I-like protein with 3'-5' exonuclease and polymerase domains